MIVTCKNKNIASYMLQLLQISWNKKWSIWLLLKSSSLRSKHCHMKSSSALWPQSIDQSINQSTNQAIKFIQVSKNFWLTWRPTWTLEFQFTLVNWDENKTSTKQRVMGWSRECLPKCHNCIFLLYRHIRCWFKIAPTQNFCGTHV